MAFTALRNCKKIRILKKQMNKYTAFDTPIITPVLRWFAKLALAVTGWRLEGQPPNLKKYVVIAAPHTSNWDFVAMMLMILSFKTKIYWFGKAELFRQPFAAFFNWFGGIPVVRSKSTGLVAQMVQKFKESENLIVGIPPEGTREKVRQWKTGFYHIAKQASVPIVLGFLDYKKKIAGLGPAFIPTGDVDADIREIQAFYAGITGKYPDQATTPS